MESKVKIVTGDALKCPICGNETFSVKNKQKEKDGQTVQMWKAACGKCGFIMKFHKELKEEN